MKLSRDQEIYQEICSLLIQSVPNDAITIELKTRIGDDYLEPRYRWYSSNNEKNWFDPIGHRKISDLTWELRELISKINNNSKFAYFEIVIYPQDGKFNINFKYEDIIFDD